MPEVFDNTLEQTTTTNVSTGEEVSALKGYTTADNTNFSFLYDSITSRAVLKPVINGSKNLKITKLSNYNPWYFNGWNGFIVGSSNACTINNRTELAGGSWFSDNYLLARRLGANPTLANCVGYAHGRVREIWQAAKDSKTITWDVSEGKWYVPSKRAYIIGTLGNWDIPACNAYAFYKHWPDSEGYYKSSLFQDDMRPVPGAIMCWKNNWSSSGLPGHVAVVEAVYNYGTDDEYVVYSESAYTNGGAQWLITTGICRRKSHASIGSGNELTAPYAYNEGYPLAGFLFSPVCQILYPGRIGNDTTSFNGLESVITQTVSDEFTEYYTEMVKSWGKVVLKELELNDKVSIEWFGNEKSNGTGKRVNYLNVDCKVLTIDSTQEYPYGVTLDGKRVLAYYKRDALKYIS